MSYATGETKNQNCRCQRRREPDLPQPVPRVERQPPPEAALLGRFQRLLQPHTRSRQQVRRRLHRALLRQQIVKRLLRLKFRRAISAPRHMLLQLMTSVIWQLAINLQL